ncbi:hypothetical protein KA005_75075 [bacterium]|nr:hypothetical protein [bacterium]
MDLNMAYSIFARGFSVQSENKVKKLSRLHQEYFVSFLRPQFITLQNVLNCIESPEGYDDEYLKESMKRIEQNIHRFRKVYINH